jgi:hypothetical protein
MRIICMKLPPEQYENAPAEFGLQDKEQRLVPGRVREDGSAQYEFNVTVKRQKDRPNFLGPYVQGTPDARFVYLSMRRKGTAPSVWIRRLKIPLFSITWEQIEAAVRTEGGALVARVSGTGAGTVPLLDGGWTVKG